jgi:hypothetical protein
MKRRLIRSPGGHKGGHKAGKRYMGRSGEVVSLLKGCCRCEHAKSANPQIKLSGKGVVWVLGVEHLPVARWRD